MISKARSTDAPEICALWNDIIAHTTHTFTTKLKTLEDIQSKIEDPDACLLVAHSADGFAGFALLGRFRSGPGYAKTAEHTIYLTQAARGQGLGAQLLKTLEEAAGARDLHVLVAALNSENQIGRRFHARAGFREVGEMKDVGRKNGVWHSLTLMQKIIPTK